MRDFGSWFSDQGKVEEADSFVWLSCRGCGKKETVNLTAYENGDTGWYVGEEIEPDSTYEGVCGGSQFCLP